MSAQSASRLPAPTTELSRDLGLFDITVVGVAAMIGAGIFVLTGTAAGTAGPAPIVAFALDGAAGTATPAFAVKPYLAAFLRFVRPLL